MIPTREECLRLMSQCGMLENIVEHSLKVAKVALFLSVELNKKGHRIDLDLVEAASLLHDLTKTECLRTKEDHAKTAYQLLEKLGYNRVGQVVAEHIVLSAGKDPCRVTEEEVVNYADKRVRHDRIVSLEERFIDLRDRYGKGPRALERLDQLTRATLETEWKIFSAIGMNPESLKDL
jgi:uncharacterized protein